MDEIRESRLIQRLQAPRSFGGVKVDNPFSFGGGLKNGGLSDEAMGLIRDIFSFDYMGAAEFEFGAVPEALSKIAKSETLIAFEFTIPLAKVQKNWRDESKETPEGDGTVYVLCPAEFRDEVQSRVTQWAKKEPGYPEVKESIRIAGALRPHEKWDTDNRGWLELDNGFFFFVDKEMWEKTCDLFAVKR